MSDEYSVYILEASDRSLYCGVAKGGAEGVSRRLVAHNEGKGAKALRGRLPASVVAWWTMPTRSVAQSSEARFKKMSRTDKILFLALNSPRNIENEHTSGVTSETSKKMRQKAMQLSGGRDIIYSAWSASRRPSDWLSLKTVRKG